MALVGVRVFSFGAIFVICLLGVKEVYAEDGTIWHLCDHHLDPTYYKEKYSCYDKNVTRKRGQYGDRLCDSPLRLVNESVHAMKKINGKPDVIFWTGDNVFHSKDKSVFTNEIVSGLTINITSLLREVFPDTEIVATLGNHDFYRPVKGAQPNYSKFYNTIADAWKPWFTTPEQEKTFRKGGYYSRKLPSGMRVASVNTNLYFSGLPVFSRQSDPYDQYQWLDRVLTKAARDGEKVHLICHVAPGLGISNGPFYRQFTDSHNKRFIEMILKHSGVLRAIYAGHQHIDSFSIFYKQGKPVVPLFLAPSVTPWIYIVPGATPPSGRNPGIRIFTYDKATFELKAMKQYFLHLAKANSGENNNWQLEYTMPADFSGMSSMSPSGLHDLVESFRKPESANFRKYYTFLYVSVNDSSVIPCDEKCKTKHVCGMTNIEYARFRRCVTTTVPSLSIKLSTELFLMAVLLIAQMPLY